MKKVLIITYYWPPSGGAGVQRWLKFAKYLPEMGWEPIIYTPRNPEIPALDESLLNDIPLQCTTIRTSIWEPFGIYKNLTGKPADSRFNAGFLEEEKGNSLMHKLSVWIRGNFFIPDAKRFWIKPSIKYLLQYLKKNPVDVIVSTGPPHSLHLIAKAVHQKTGISWVADFRDPWTQIDFYNKLKLTRFSDKKHKRLEKSVLMKASVVTVVGRTMATEFNAIYQRDYHVITNGYDRSDVMDSSDDQKRREDRFTIIHVGSMNADRNHRVFWKALKSCIDEIEGFKSLFKLELVGKNDVQVLQDIEQYKLADYTQMISYIQHDRVIQKENEASVLYLPLNDTPNAKGILTGKFFEYLAAKRPILAIGPCDGDVAAILKETNAGTISDFEDYNAVRAQIENYFMAFRNGTLLVKSSGIKNYERSELTKAMVKLFESLQ